MSRVKLSDTDIEFLKSQFMLEMDAIYQFELIELQPMDVESEATSQDSTEDIDEL